MLQSLINSSNVVVAAGGDQDNKSTQNERAHRMKDQRRTDQDNKSTQNADLSFCVLLWTLEYHFGKALWIKDGSVPIELNVQKGLTTYKWKLTFLSSIYRFEE